MRIDSDHKVMTIQAMGNIVFIIVIFTFSILVLPLALFFIPVLVILFALHEVEIELNDYHSAK